MANPNTATYFAPAAKRRDREVLGADFASESNLAGSNTGQIHTSSVGESYASLQDFRQDAVGVNGEALNQLVGNDAELNSQAVEERLAGGGQVTGGINPDQPIIGGIRNRTGRQLNANDGLVFGTANDATYGGGSSTNINDASEGQRYETFYLQPAVMVRARYDGTLELWRRRNERDGWDIETVANRWIGGGTARNYSGRYEAQLTLFQELDGFTSSLVGTKLLNFTGGVDRFGYVGTSLPGYPPPKSAVWVDVAHSPALGIEAGADGSWVQNRNLQLLVRCDFRRVSDGALSQIDVRMTMGTV